jgi:hypothetical protein
MAAFTQSINNSYFGNSDYLSFVGIQNGNVSPSGQAGFSSPSDSAPSSWNTLEELQLSPEMFMDFDSSSFDGDEETSSVVSSLHKASKKISKASPKSDAQSASQRRAKRARNPWTPKEDLKLMELMKKYGQSWAMISSVMEGRTGKQVRDRYLNKLRPNIKCGDWSAEEDERLISLLRTVGNRWSLIATHLPGRTEGQVKNRFYSCIKKRLSGSQSQSFSTSPQVDEQLSFDFNQEFDANMFNTCVSDQSTVQSPNSQKDMADPTDVISYNFFSQMPPRTYSYGLGPITHDSQIDGMLNKVTDYYVEKNNTNNFSLDVDSFFSDDLKVAPVVAMEEETERYEQLSRRKAYLELALANTINEIKGL